MKKLTSDKECRWSIGKGCSRVITLNGIFLDGGEEVMEQF